MVIITLEIFLDLVIRPIRSEPEVALWWDGLQLDSREDWNEDWAIVDGAGYHDIQVGFRRGRMRMTVMMMVRVQELEDGSVVFVESNKLTVRYHTICPRTIQGLKQQLKYINFLNIFLPLKYF